MNETLPLVSICCVTYNHASFIRKCLDGFLMQETTFPVEILIHDDASTDGTDGVVREYARKYPDKIYPLYEKENKFSNGYAGKMDLFNYNRARGKYIAYCEGDDYWTDPLKLQKQVDFMESHSNCSVTFHDFDIWLGEKNKTQKSAVHWKFGEGMESIKLSLSLFFEQWITQPCTMMFRTDCLPAGRDLPYRFYRDQHEIFHLLKAGDGYVLNFNGAVRTKHQGGIHSGMDSKLKESALAVSIAQELYENNRGTDELKLFFLSSLDWAIGLRYGVKGSHGEALHFIMTRFKVSRSFKCLLKQLLKII